MYKVTSRNTQSRTERVLPKHLSPEEESLTLDERIEMLAARNRKLEEAIHAAPKDSPERRQLGQAKILLQNELSKLKGRKKKTPNIAPCFVDAAFRLLPPETYQAVMEEARHIYAVRHKAAEEERARVHRANTERCLAKQG